jgi:hypothetical protein
MADADKAIGARGKIDVTQVEKNPLSCGIAAGLRTATKLAPISGPQDLLAYGCLHEARHERVHIPHGREVSPKPRRI